MIRKISIILAFYIVLLCVIRGMNAFMDDIVGPQITWEQQRELAKLGEPVVRRDDIKRLTSSVIGNWMPPDEFTGNTQAVIYTVTPEDVPKYCVNPDDESPQMIQACAGTDELGRPRIIMPNPCHYPWNTYASTLCHELGHVNGWRHPDGPGECGYWPDDGFFNRDQCFEYRHREAFFCSTWKANGFPSKSICKTIQKIKVRGDNTDSVCHYSDDWNDIVCARPDDYT